MKLEGTHAFGVGPERVWAALHDPELLARAVPGLRRLDVTGADEYALAVSVGVGSVKGTYDGTFALTEQDPPSACTVRAAATGTPGSVDVRARMRLSKASDETCELGYEADAKVTGPIAGVGQRLVVAAAKRTTQDFLANVERELTTPSSAPAGAGAADGPASFVPARPVPDTARVAVVSLLVGFLLALAGVAVGRWTARR